MPASRIDEAVRRLSPEPLLCWSNGQSLESRYSSSAASGGAGRAAGAMVLRRQLSKARLPDAVRMPRFPLIAVSASSIYLFAGPLPDRAAFAVLERDRVRVNHGGNTFWRRLDIHADQDGVPRSYTMMVFGLGGGRKRLDRLISVLHTA